MTSNSLTYAANKERERSNRVNEKETHRSNKANETLKRIEVTGKTVKNITGGVKDLATSWTPSGGDLLRLSSRSNDPIWYMKNKELSSNAALVSFSTPLGRPLELSRQFSLRMPGVFSMNFLPTIGNTDAIDIASRSFYAFIRHANSGSRNYDAPDLMQYIYSVDSIYFIIAHMQRTYGLLNASSTTNRYVNKALLESVYGSTAISKMAELRYLINETIARVNSLAVPKDLSYFERHVFLSKSVFTDGQFTKSQFYIFNPSHYFVYDEADGLCQANTFGWGTDYLAKMSLIINRQLTAILQSESAGIMSGDILKAYGSEGIYQLTSMPDDYKVEFVYSPEILAQIKNATLLPEPIGSIGIQNLSIRQDPTTGVLYQGSTIGSQKIGILLTRVNEFLPAETNWVRGVIFTSDSEQPSPEEVMVSSRLSATLGATTIPTGGLGPLPADTRAYEVIQHGSEVIIGARIFYLDYSGNIIKVEINHNFDYDNEEDSTHTILPLVSAFDWAPFIFNYTGADDATEPVYALEVGNTILLSSEELKRLHDTALLSQFSVTPTSFSTVKRGQ